MNTLDLRSLKETHQKRLQEQRDQRRIDEIMQELRQRVKEHDRIPNRQDN
jgi:hypothetical protein